jgi:hypothetical protein
MSEPEKKSPRKNSREAFRENAKKDKSPNWDNHEQLNDEEFLRVWTKAMAFYRVDCNSKDLKLNVITWMSKNGYSKSDISKFRKTKEWRCTHTVGGIASCLLRGMPPQRPGFNNGRNYVEWLRQRIEEISQQGKDDIDKDAEGNITLAPVVSIQDRIKEQSIAMNEEIDLYIDKFHENQNEFNPRGIKIINLFKAKGVKSAHARFIKGFHEFDYNELIELSSGEADEQLREAYERYPRKNIKKLIEFYEIVRTACDQIIAESKVLRKPKAKKVKPAEDLVKKFKFKVSDNKLGIASVPVAGIIGAQMVVIYNAKTRKIGIYKAKTISGLSVKGATILEFVEASNQKTLRKPDVQLKEFKEQTTQKRVEMWFDKIKSTETKLNGRSNDDTMILKIFK